MLFREPVARPEPSLFYELARSPDVTILVGLNEESFMFPRDLLGYYSPYFKACFNGNFKEGKEGVLRLPYENPKHIKLMNDCLRDGRASIPGFEINHDVDGTELSNYFNSCSELLQFADKYDFRELVDTAQAALEHTIYFRCSCDDCLANFDCTHVGTIFKLVSPHLLSRCLDLLPHDCRFMRDFATGCLVWLDKDWGMKKREEREIKLAIGELVHSNDNLALVAMRLMVSPSNYHPEDTTTGKAGERIEPCHDIRLEVDVV